MKRNARTAFSRLQKKGFTVWERLNWSRGAHFEISGEDAMGPDYYSDYWGEKCGLKDILEEQGLYFEWVNAGVAAVYDA